MNGTEMMENTVINSKVDNNRGNNIPRIVWDLNTEDIQKCQYTATGNCIKSPDVVAHDLEWRIRLYPNGVSHHPNHVVLFLNILRIPPQIYAIKVLNSTYVPISFHYLFILTLRMGNG